jgi:ABC-type cobalamin/Fe3+-siderophores transport system ATPase subunit
MLDARNVSFAYNGSPALEGVNLSLRGGQVITILGPNGSGKSTLLKVLMGSLPGQGRIQWIGRDLSAWRRRDLARCVAYLPQTPAWEATQAVADTLRLGRAPYWGALGLESERDEKIVYAVAQSLELSDLLDRRMDELSGGQRQRVLLGRCMAQEPKAMLLDEPDTFLDLKHQIELHRLLRDLAKNRGLGVLLASHDLNLASLFADEVIILRGGRIAAMGSPRDVLAPAILEEVYGVPMERIERVGGASVIIPRIASDQ